MINKKRKNNGDWSVATAGPRRPTGRPPRGARQWPYTNPRGARAYQKNPNCNAEWRSRILPPSQLGKSHGKTDSTINRLNSNEKSVNSLGVFRPGSGGENPRKCQKKPATSTCRPFADSPVPRDRSTDRYFAQEVPLRRIKIWMTYLWGLSRKTPKRLFSGRNLKIPE